MEHGKGLPASRDFYFSNLYQKTASCIASLFIICGGTEIKFCDFEFSRAQVNRRYLSNLSSSKVFLEYLHFFFHIRSGWSIVGG